MLILTFGTPRVTFEFRCEECGYLFVIPSSWDFDEPDSVICSTCDVRGYMEWRRRKECERHTPKRVDEHGNPIEIPPMIPFRPLSEEESAYLSPKLKRFEMQGKLWKQ